MNGTIYMRTSPAGNRYIGQTVKQEEKRWKEHVRDSKLDSRYSVANTSLSKEIRKYGKDSFTVEILESNIKTEEELNRKEIYWIKKYNTFTFKNMNGLNDTIGGLGHRKYTPDDFQELYDSGLSLLEIAKIVGSSPRTVSDNLVTNKSENYRRSREFAFKKNPPRPVSCYDVDTCEKIKSFSRISEAVYFFTGVRESKFIHGVIRGSQKSAFGFLWKYDDQPMSVIEEQYKRYHDGCKTHNVSVVNIETNEVFSSMNKAAKRYNIPLSQIRSCCKGKRENAGSFYWRYKNQEAKPYTNTRGKRVICLETGVIYNSIKEATDDIGCCRTVMTDCLKKRRDTAGGYHWEYFTENEGIG